MEPRSPRQLADELRPSLTSAEDHATLDALLAKAEYQEGVCTICHGAAVEEGKRQEREAREAGVAQ